MRGSSSAALRCERRLAILERSETAKRCESLLNALLENFTSIHNSLFKSNIRVFFKHVL